MKTAITRERCSIITEQQLNSLIEAEKPLVKWLNENCNPHAVVIVDCASVILTEGVAGSPITEFIKD